MESKTYEILAMRTEADQVAILTRLYGLGPSAMRLDNAARGVANDAGELSSAVMKYIEYGKPLNRINVIEEVGDILWRLAQVCKAIDSSLDEAMEANIRKLEIRYPEKYTDELASNRDREAEAKAISETALLQKKYGERNPSGSVLSILGNEYDISDKVCEVCRSPATHACHDTSADFQRVEHHYFCKAHVRPTNVLPMKKV